MRLSLVPWMSVLLNFLGKTAAKLFRLIGFNIITADYAHGRHNIDIYYIINNPDDIFVHCCLRNRAWALPHLKTEDSILRLKWND